MKRWRSDSFFFFIVILLSLQFPLLRPSWLRVSHSGVSCTLPPVCLQLEYIIEHWFLSIGLCTNVPKIGVNRSFSAAVVALLGLHIRNVEVRKHPDAPLALYLLLR